MKTIKIKDKEGKWETYIDTDTVASMLGITKETTMVYAIEMKQFIGNTRLHSRFYKLSEIRKFIKQKKKNHYKRKKKVDNTGLIS